MPDQNDTAKNSSEQKKPSHNGGQYGNQNARKHGLDSQKDKKAIRHGLTVGRLPKKFFAMERKLLEFRVTLEKAVCDIYGEEISITQAVSVNMAVEAYAQVLKARKYYREGYYRTTRGDDGKEVLVEALTLEQKLKLDKVIVDGTARMNKAIRGLGLERGGSNPLASMYVDDPDDDDMGMGGDDDDEDLDGDGDGD